MGHLDNDHRQIFRNLFYPERERKLDIEKWVAYCARAGATSVALDIKTQAYALYNSKLIRKDPAIGKRDFAAELSKAARKHGLKWCAYIPPYQHESLREKGRAWQERFEDGSIAAEKGGGFMKTSFCWNTPYLDLFCAILKEIALKYKPDGFYLDGMRYHGAGDRLTCYCDFCREKFRKEYGLPLPSKKDGAERYSKSMILFLKARKKWIADATRAVRKAVDSVDPEITLYLNNKYGGG
ncbi:MAG: alpha-L-fucosidase, partial [Kiritimatiellia bacterium]